MRIIHLSTEKLRTRVIVRPTGALGTHGFYPAAWQAISVTHRQARNHALIRARWNAANPNMVAASIDAPVVCEVRS